MKNVLIIMALTFTVACILMGFNTVPDNYIIYEPQITKNAPIVSSTPSEETVSDYQWNLNRKATLVAQYITMETAEPGSFKNKDAGNCTNLKDGYSIMPVGPKGNLPICE